MRKDWEGTGRQRRGRETASAECTAYLTRKLSPRKSVLAFSKMMHLLRMIG
jgi:hypothetical protein